jgi:type VI secretion system secreted protein VgrG
VQVQRFGFHAQPTVVVLRFNQPLDPARATNPSNYFFRNFKSRPVGAASVTYDPATLSVQVVARHPLNIIHKGQLLVIGRRPNGLTNTAGVPLDGGYTNRPGFGSDFSTLLNFRNLAGPSTGA